MGGAREADTSLALEPAAPPGELPKAHTSELTRGPNAMPQTALRHPLRRPAGSRPAATGPISQALVEETETPSFRGAAYVRDRIL